MAATTLVPSALIANACQLPDGVTEDAFDQVSWLAFALGAVEGNTTDPTGTKRVPTKTVTSVRATRVRSPTRKRFSATLSSFGTWLLGVKIGASTHSWQRMSYLEDLCIFITLFQMS